MKYFLLILIALPTVEIAVLLFTGRTIGFWPTLALMISTGVIGAYLAKQQGLETLRKAQEQMRYGQVPGSALLDGICVLVGGTLLLTPGFVSDLFGLFLLLPPTRKIIKPLLLKLLRNMIDKGNITIIR
ncbi:FxsA family protein [Peribacillus glennii]|uniref:Membrane protein FxsA n=1 Tax=Peribacillus glennii TaxID=2303991 RepID=A0A372LI64_9BACI|nr:FxsA family protein [Peribacillus glennii]RFU65980.1 membrane protein FxsA [Peribacillus glennii]